MGWWLVCARKPDSMPLLKGDKGAFENHDPIAVLPESQGPYAHKEEERRQFEWIKLDYPDVLTPDNEAEIKALLAPSTEKDADGFPVLASITRLDVDLFPGGKVPNEDDYSKMAIVETPVALVDALILKPEVVPE